MSDMQNIYRFGHSYGQESTVHSFTLDEFTTHEEVVHKFLEFLSLVYGYDLTTQYRFVSRFSPEYEDEE